jgi:hypothetical protein
MVEHHRLKTSRREILHHLLYGGIAEEMEKSGGYPFNCLRSSACITSTLQAL